MQQQSTNDADTTDTADDGKATRAKKEEQMKRGGWVLQTKFEKKKKKKQTKAMAIYSVLCPFAWRRILIVTSMTLDEPRRWKCVCQEMQVSQPHSETLEQNVNKSTILWTATNQAKRTSVVKTFRHPDDLEGTT